MQAKLFHYKGWEEGELRKCVDILVGLSRQELIALYTSRWLVGVKTLRDEIQVEFPATDNKDFNHFLKERKYDKIRFSDIWDRTK